MSETISKSKVREIIDIYLEGMPNMKEGIYKELDL